MAPPNRPNGYTTSQIAPHQLIAAMVIFQLVLGDSIKPAYRAFRRGTTCCCA
jgi:cytochrome b561